MTVEQPALREVGYDKHLSLIEEAVESSVQTSSPMFSLGDWLILVWQPRCPWVIPFGPVALRPHLSMSMPMYRR